MTASWIFCRVSSFPLSILRLRTSQKVSSRLYLYCCHFPVPSESHKPGRGSPKRGFVKACGNTAILDLGFGGTAPSVGGHERTFVRDSPMEREDLRLILGRYRVRL